jgi:hypothetical protein
LGALCDPLRQAKKPPITKGGFVLNLEYQEMKRSCGFESTSYLERYATLSAPINRSDNQLSDFVFRDKLALKN